jgi:FlaG/FlaF family flagellin (archaellin)
MIHKKNCTLTTKSKRSVRAVSVVIATLLMIAIAVAASIVMYAWVMGYFGSVTSEADTVIVIQSVTRTRAYVQNVGSAIVTLSNIYINGEMLSPNQFTMTPSNGELPESQTAAIILSSPIKGEKATVKVTATNGISAEITKTFIEVAYFKKITLNNIVGSHNDFPAYINIQNDKQIASAATSQELIYFTDKTGNQVLPHEIISYNSGNLKAYVRIPTLSEGTEIRICYGAYPKNEPYVPSVWNNGYAAVWHMDQTPAGTNSILDSTTNNRHGTPINMEIGDQQTGKVGGSLNFDGTNEQVTTSSFAPGTTSMTAEAWIKPTGTARSQRIICKESGGGSVLELTVFDLGISQSSQLDIRLRTGTSTTTFAAGNIPRDGSWTHVAFTYDGSNIISYINGSPVGSRGKTGTIVNHDCRIVIANYDGTGSRYFSGSIDEGRISNIARSADWLQTQYRNIDDPANFVTIGNQQKVL